MAEVADDISTLAYERRTAGAMGKGIPPKCRAGCPLPCAGIVQKMHGTVVLCGAERNHRA